MAITTIENRDFDVQILTETVQGRFAQQSAFMGSALVSQGAVRVEGTMPVADPNFIGNEITVPYFGTIGKFVNNPDGEAVVPRTISQTHEKATITRSSLAFEVSRWAQHSSPFDRDPYAEASDQIMVAAEREMDDRIIAAAMTTPLGIDVYSAGSPQILDHATLVDARAQWGDENRDVVAMIVHSRTTADLRKLTDNIGRPLLLDSQRDDDVPRFAGVALIESDKAPLTGSSMGAVTSAGTAPPVATLAGTPKGAWNLRLECTTGGAHETARVRFSTDGGRTWSAPITTAAATVALPLIDPATDSIVGVNGETGLTVAFAAGTFNVNNVWTSKAVLKVTSLLVKRGALAFWYNRNAMAFETDKNILRHTDIAAMHLYGVAHRYRRVATGTKPGVVAIQHNVLGY